MAYFNGMGVAFQVKAQFYDPKVCVVAKFLHFFVENAQYNGEILRGDNL